MRRQTIDLNKRHHRPQTQNKRRYIHPQHGMKQGEFANKIQQADQLILRHTASERKMVGIVADAVTIVQRLETFEAEFRNAVGLAKAGKFDKAASSGRLAQAHFASIPGPTHLLEPAKDVLDEFVAIQEDAVKRNPYDPKFQYTKVLFTIAKEQDAAAAQLKPEYGDEHPIVLQLEGCAEGLRSGAKLAREGKHEEAAGIQGAGTSLAVLRGLAKEFGNDIPALNKQLALVEKFVSKQLYAAGWSMERAYREFPELRPANWQARRNAERSASRRKRGRKAKPQARAS